MLKEDVKIISKEECNGLKIINNNTIIKKEAKELYFIKVKYTIENGPENETVVQDNLTDEEIINLIISSLKEGV